MPYLQTEGKKGILTPDTRVDGAGISRAVGVIGQPSYPVVGQPVPISNDRVYRRRSSVSGTLRSLSHASNPVHDYLQGGADTIKNSIVIHFPSMPEVIELARSAEYKVATNFAVPDGIHLYRYTNPLIIPFTFTLHATDEEYCSAGALTLLHIASRLHALTLPVSDHSAFIVSAQARGELSTDTPQTDAAESKRSEELSLSYDGKEPPRFPVACLLDLMHATEGPGIRCVGYVRSVNVKLKRPFLKGALPDQFNLPSSAEYSFEFVHRPGHTNAFTNTLNNFDISGAGATAFADDVKNNLYNSIGLLKDSGVSYQGFKT